MQNPAASSDEVSKIVELTIQNRTEEATAVKDEISRRDLEEFQSVIRCEMTEFNKVQLRHVNQARRWAILAWVCGGMAWPLSMAWYLSRGMGMSLDPALFAFLTFACGAAGGLWCYCCTRDKKDKSAK